MNKRKNVIYLFCISKPALFYWDIKLNLYYVYKYTIIKWKH